MSKPKANKGRLDDTIVRRAPDGDHTDGRGLSLRVANDGSRRSWVLRTMVDGKTTVRGLGAHPKVSLAAARKAADAMRSELKAGGTAERPAPVRRERRRPEPIQSTSPTFRQCAEAVIELRSPLWRGQRTANQWPETLESYVYPTIGDKPVSEITSRDIVGILTPIWTDKPKTCIDVRQRISMVMDWSIANEYRHDNPVDAARRGFPANRKAPKQHHPAMPFEDVGEFLGTLRGAPWLMPTNALCLEFQILTAARPGEARNATWAEIDLSKRIWTIPAHKMKSGKEHRVPLSSRAVELLQTAREYVNAHYPDGLVFRNLNTNQPLSYNASAGPLKRRGLAYVPHGFRASFRSWAMEQPGFAWAACERALAHAVGGAEVEAYARGDLLEQRRELMQAWADYVCQS
jgi:integrase